MDEARADVGANGPATPQRNGARFQQRVDLFTIRILDEALIVLCARFLRSTPRWRSCYSGARFPKDRRRGEAHQAQRNQSTDHPMQYQWVWQNVGNIIVNRRWHDGEESHQNP